MTTCQLERSKRAFPLRQRYEPSPDRLDKRYDNHRDNLLRWLCQDGDLKRDHHNHEILQLQRTTYGATWRCSTLDYLLTDLLGGTAVALNTTGTVLAAHLYQPYGAIGYSWGTMPTAYNFTGQRLDSETGLLYYNFRYYDPLSGRFVRGDTKQNNASGMDPYAYVGDNPETRNDPSGHCPWCIGAAIGGLIGLAVAAVSVYNAVQTHTLSWGTIGRVVVDVGMGAVDGGLIGSGFGAGAGVAGMAALVGTGIGATTGIIAHNIDPKHNDGIQSVFESAAMGGITNSIAAGFAGTSITLFGNAARSVGGFFMRAGTQAIIQAGAAAFGNSIQQNLAIADGDQKGWDWNSFLWTTGTAGVIGALTQGIGDSLAAYWRIPYFSRGVAAQAPGLLQKINNVVTTQNWTSGIAQGAAQVMNSLMRKNYS